MTIKKIFHIITALFIVILIPSRSLAIDIKSAPEKVEKYGMYRLEFSLPYFDGNPFDEAEIDIQVRIVTPKKQILSVSAFCLKNNKIKNTSSWEARFTPVSKGRYKYHIEISGIGALRERTDADYFDVVGDGNNGFLRESANNPYYLVFDSGKPFYGIGHNVGWVTNSSTAVFNRYFTKMADNGCNMTRVLLCSWSFPLEWKTLGEYDQASSLKLDKLMELAEKKGLYIMLCLDTYGSLMAEQGYWNENNWDINPYNKKNGGPCDHPEDFFTDPEARRSYKNKLRYIISRWGYSTNIFAFELWNEYYAPIKWVKEMAGYIKSINPSGQLITTSHGYPFDKVFKENDIWDLNEIDVISAHEYGDGSRVDLTGSLIQKNKKIVLEYHKPFIVSEFGIDSFGDDRAYDPRGKGPALHNSLWGSVMSRSLGTPMNWWWNSYIRPKELYPHYKALSRFVNGVNWDSKNIKYADISTVAIEGSGGGASDNTDVVIIPQNKWEKININEFEILNNGDISGAGIPNKYLHGTKKKELGSDLIFYLQYPSGGKFVMRVGTVSQGADIHVYLDGKEILTREFTAGPGNGPWKESRYLKKYDVYQCVYNEDMEIYIPRGRHTIRFSNTGKDWLGIEKITLKDYVAPDKANTRCLGLVVGDETLVWVQNKAYNWKNVSANKEVARIKGAYFDIAGMREGVYKIEWWDTFSGTIIKKDKKMPEDGILLVEIPEFSKDIACKIKRTSNY